MRQFVSRVVTLMAIIIMLNVYQFVITERADAEEIARLEYELGQTTVSQTSSDYEDGIYEGSAEGFGGPIKVRVTVEDGAIADIEIVSHDGEDNSYFTMAQDVTQEILNAQSADVDIVSGATYSSTGIKNAVAAALEEAVSAS